MHFFTCCLLAAVFTALFSVSCSAEFPAPPKEILPATHSTASAVFAGGCFWGVEGVFEQLKGVKEVVAGYSGGEANTAHYEMVSTGNTGHAESVKIIYDPAIISFGTLLEVFFSAAHDPTQLNYQGPDEGTQYRSAVFYIDDVQKAITEEYIKKINSVHIFRSPVVTQVSHLKAFYSAEKYHQKFMQNNPNDPYILYWDKPKVDMLRKNYPDLVSGK
jgi:peptide-methionine (S)-S-oxide reductase